MKKLLAISTLFLALTLFAGSAYGQEQQQLKGIKKRLATPLIHDSLTVIRGAVQIREKDDAATIINSYLYTTPKVVDGFRIVIFMSNTQTARRDAYAARDEFHELKTGELSYLSYENPYFKVTIGNFLSQEEAVVVLGKIQKSFPKAFITQAHISTREFAK